MMLSGLKTGKKKRKDPPSSAANDSSNYGGHQVEGKAAGSITLSSKKQEEAVERLFAPKDTSASTTSSATAAVSSSNQSVADQLRAQLLAGVDSSWKDDLRRHQNLEQRGRIQVDKAFSFSAKSDSKSPIVVMNLPSSSNNNNSNKDHDPSIFDMLKEEKASTMSLAEMEARTAMRTLKKRRIKQSHLDNMDSDEEEHLMMQQQKQVLDATSEKAVRRNTSRAIARNDQQDRAVAKCWWWMESNQFERKRLIALGNHVSLSMAPLNLSLIKGQHFYLVPLTHVESLAAAEMEVWDEVVRFQTSLRQLFDKQNMGVIFFETVLPSQSFWQTRLECVAIPKEQWMDAPLFIRQALLEQAQENGTHQKLMTTSATKGLRALVPKNFYYIYFEYDQQQQGYVQMIETRDFPQDFAVDTVAGMLQEDPMRFRRKEKISPEEERSIMLQFLDKWKDLDWTVQLDG